MKVFSYLLVISLFILVLVSSGCIQEEIKCDPPYIRHADSCCLDVNNNKICDKDEGIIKNASQQPNQTSNQTSPEKETTGEAIVCDPPYIRHADGCCLDTNGNKICDSDEPAIGANETTSKTQGNISMNTTITPAEGTEVQGNESEVNQTETNETAEQAFEEEHTETNETLSMWCGNGVCDENETNQNCCMDCDCDSGYYCVNNTCVELPEFQEIPSVEMQMFFFCGDGICSSNENSSTCCADCGCESGYICSNNTCVKISSLPFLEPLPLFNLTLSRDVLLFEDSDKVYNIFNPRIYGDLVAYEGWGREDGSYVYNLYLYSLETGQRTKIPHQGFDVDLYGSKVVFRSLISDSPTGYPNVYLYDFGNGFEGFIQPKNWVQDNPKISNSYVVWRNAACSPLTSCVGQCELYTYHLPTRTMSRIYHCGENEILGEFELWNDNVVYTVHLFSDTGENPVSKLYLYNIPNRRIHLIVSTRDYWISKVAVYGNRVAYLTHDDSDISKIFLYDGDTKLTKLVTSGDSEKKFLRMWGDLIVWADTRDTTSNTSGSPNWNIYMYNITSKSTERVTDSESDEFDLDIHGDRIVYVADRLFSNGRAGYKLYAHFLD